MRLEESREQPNQLIAYADYDNSIESAYFGKLNH